MELTISKPKKKFKKGGKHFTADFYWQAIFFTGVIVAVASFALGAYLFMEMSKKFDISAEDVTSNRKPISKPRLDQALKYFSGRQQKMDEILNSPSAVVDPSI